MEGNRLQCGDGADCTGESAPEAGANNVAVGELQACDGGGLENVYDGLYLKVVDEHTKTELL
jgi:hypothetical protein